MALHVNYGELFFPTVIKNFNTVLVKLFLASFHFPIRNVIEVGFTLFKMEKHYQQQPTTLINAPSKHHA